MERVSLNDLDAVLAIARRASFRAAAIDLGMSTTALSNAIGKLEANLGVRLFNRTTRSVSLTDAGRLFVEHVAPALGEVQGALEVVRAQRDQPSGMLRINAAAFAAREIIGPLVLEFLRRYPQMQVDLVTEGRLVDIVAEGFDLGVRVADLVPSDMISLSLGRPQRYAVVASAAYLAARGTPRLPADLQRHSCVRVRLPDGALFRWRFANGNSAQQIDVQGPITLDEASLARAAVMAGVGLGYFMEQDVREDIAAGRLVRVLDDWTPPLPGLCLYYAGRRNPSAGMSAFLELAREVAEQACREGT
ncbi:LysR family transcriptional regulator [Pseudomonas putida]|uniref:LysR family transcriptional regulator n=1 Tax=Pseudomonas putida TaxID=303 RepID=UPI00081925B6|nr:LysR family transcriptional regulator [Pseudomonas putida]OCT29637.1 LysR family transcriptional regulator [Pseudomonas putida]OCT31333.1 LysR family transcriptional regulator [Pseudomonas putida]OCT33575.1 LysR family transcriptional regulator [Pseudomonas putida]OCT40021.1 LysR family transcriptional regulator [Pseudomonas putida]